MSVAMAEQKWRGAAACAGAGSVFFDPARASEAKAVCLECTVRPECLTYWRDDLTPQQREHGVWAGTSESDRKP